MNNAKNIIIYICVFLAFVFVLTRTGTNGTEERSATDRTLGTIKGEQQIVTVEVERIGNASGSIGESVNGASREIGESRRTSEAIANGIAEFKRTLAECQRLAGENAKIFDRVDGTN